MQRFQFRLEALLNYRKLLTDQAQAEFGQAIVAWQAEVKKLESLIDEKDKLNVLLRQMQNKPVPVDDLVNCSSFSERLKLSIIEQRQNVLCAEKHREECRDKLSENLKQQKLVEKLKEKRLTQYQEELLSQEQKELDEIGLQLYVRGV